MSHVIIQHGYQSSNGGGKVDREKCDLPPAYSNNSCKHARTSILIRGYFLNQLINLHVPALSQISTFTSQSSEPAVGSWFKRVNNAKRCCITRLPFLRPARPRGSAVSHPSSRCPQTFPLLCRVHLLTCRSFGSTRSKQTAYPQTVRAIPRRSLISYPTWNVHSPTILHQYKLYFSFFFGPIIYFKYGELQLDCWSVSNKWPVRR